MSTRRHAKQPLVMSVCWQRLLQLSEYSDGISAKRNDDWGGIGTLVSVSKHVIITVPTKVHSEPSRVPRPASRIHRPSSARFCAKQNLGMTITPKKTTTPTPTPTTTPTPTPTPTAAMSSSYQPIKIKEKKPGVCDDYVIGTCKQDKCPDLHPAALDPNLRKDPAFAEYTISTEEGTSCQRCLDLLLEVCLFLYVYTSTMILIVIVRQKRAR